MNDKHVKNMVRLFEEADESGDGMLSFEEFADIIQDPRVKKGWR